MYTGTREQFLKHGFKEWEKDSLSTFKWFRGFQKAILHTALKTDRLRVTASNPGEPSVQVCIRVYKSKLQRVLNYAHQSLDYYLNGRPEGKEPILANEWDWYQWVTIKDIRFCDPQSGIDTLWFKGTGFTGINEFDIETCLRQFFLSQGIQLLFVYDETPYLQTQSLFAFTETQR